jgi:hypothetical protein
MNKTVEAIADGFFDAQSVIADKDAEISKLNSVLIFVERWANHHGTKPHMTAQEALGCIQHHPRIRAITQAYADGQAPETRDPYAEIVTLTAERDALKAARYAYAGEFSEGADGERDVGSIHANIRALKADRDALHECTNEYDAWIRFNDAGNGSYPDFLAAMTKEPK